MPPNQGLQRQQTPAKSGVGRQVRYNQGAATLQPLIAMAYILEDLRHATLRLLIKDTPRFSPEETKALLGRMDIERTACAA